MTLIDVSDTPSVEAAPVADASVKSSTHSWLFSAGVIAIYVALGLCAFWPVLPWTSDRLFGTAGDSVLAMWFLAWVPHSLAHGLNPFFSHALLAPQGVNLAQNTEAPFLGLLTTPLALFMGPIARANVLMILAMPASATAAYIVLRKWGVWAVAAAIGGLLYGFSPYVVGQALGHVVLVFLAIPPFIALTVASILRRQGSPIRLGIQLGLLVAAQYLSEPEIMTTVAIFIGWAVLCVAVRYRRKVAEAARSVITSLAVAVGVAGVLLAYPLWMLLEGPQRYVGTAQPVDNPYFNDLTNLVFPGPLQRITFGLHFAGLPGTNASESGGYIGIPILIIAAYFAWRSRRSPRMQLTLAVLVAALLMSFGSHLWIHAHDTGIPLPFLLLEKLPLMDNLLPDRMSMETAACIAAILAFGLDDIHRAAARRRRHSHGSKAFGTTVLALLVLAVAVFTQLPQWPEASQAAHGLPVVLSDAIPSGNPVAVTYPIASPLFVEPMTWQADAGFRFTLVGGYAEHPDPTGAPTGMPNPMSPPGLDQFLEGQEAYNPYLPPVPVTPALIATVRYVAASDNIRLLIVDRWVKGSKAVVSAFTQAFGPPRAVTSRYVLWGSDTGAL